MLTPRLLLAGIWMPMQPLKLSRDTGRRRLPIRCCGTQRPSLVRKTGREGQGSRGHCSYKSNVYDTTAHTLIRVEEYQQDDGPVRSESGSVGCRHKLPPRSRPICFGSSTEIPAPSIGFPGSVKYGSMGVRALALRDEYKARKRLAGRDARKREMR
jgi:hypothetical protein